MEHIPTDCRTCPHLPLVSTEDVRVVVASLLAQRQFPREKSAALIDVVVEAFGTLAEARVKKWYGEYRILIVVKNGEVDGVKHSFENSRKC